jgi:predicted MPP superfamily phosphohydrolase
MKFPLTRRRFLLGSGLLGAGVGAYAWRVEPHWLTVVERDLPIRGLPPDWNGRMLAQISDLHVDPRVDFDYLTSAIQRVNKLKPDLLAITGDFMSKGDAGRTEEVARLLDHLTMPPLGCFACLGNHDYGDGWKKAELADLLVRRVTDCGVRVLRNASEVVLGLRIVGVDDFWGRNFHPEAVLPKLSPDEAAVVLCHNPDVADLNVWGNYRGWILSGHTHGGQCKPPFLNPPLLPVLNRRYTSGEFDLGDGRFLYINRGLGHLLRVRFNARPEVTLFRLVRA